MELPPKRPALFAAAVFLLAVVIARFNSYISPGLLQVHIGGMHIHHYVFGIFILTAAGYLALVLRSEGARFVIFLLYGLGVGLTFDEFGFWFNPPFVRGARFNTNGLLIVAAVFVSVAVVTAVVKRGRSASEPGRSLVGDAERTLESNASGADGAFIEQSTD